jgi:hypothetical protein
MRSRQENATYQECTKKFETLRSRTKEDGGGKGIPRKGARERNKRKEGGGKQERWKKMAGRRNTYEYARQEEGGKMREQYMRCDV